MRFFLFFILWPFTVFADTIDHYISISKTIPQMEIKADPQAQAWARSARHVLAITNETIAETLTQANEVAKRQGRALFCLPPDVQLNGEIVQNLIDKTYQSISSQQADKDKMTISQIAWLGIIKNYPCKENMTSPLKVLSQP